MVVSAAGASSMVCSWIVVACMSVACEKESSTTSFLSNSNSSSKRWARKRRLLSKCNATTPADRSNGGVISSLCGSMISLEGFSVSSCLSPCDEYYSSKGLSSSVPPPYLEVVTRKKPPTKQRRVVVTGMEVETPIGHNPDEFYNNLLEGVSGISEIEAFDCSNYPTRIAGEIKSFSTDGWVAPKLSKRN